MSKRPPIALVVFSNDLNNYLANIEIERKVIEEALEHYDDTNRLNIITRSAVSVDELFRLFNRYSGRIALFHFAGHAEGHGLQLNTNFVHDEMARARGIAALIEREVREGQLKLVFLNGCSTEPQVEGLKAVGVPAVIATRYPINDKKAVGFARTFYRTWAASDDQAAAFEPPLPTLNTAFKAALAYLKTRYAIVLKRQQHGFIGRLGNAPEKKGAPWALFTTTPNQTLDFQQAQESKTFNEFLTRRLIEVLALNNRRIARFLRKVKIKAKERTDWETQPRYSNKAKGIIVHSFVGVLGIQLQKLFAIGKEDLSITKQRKYIKTCLFTTKRTLKLLTFALMSKLWDFRNHPQHQIYVLSDAQEDAIQHFFEDDFELDIQGHLKLLSIVHSVFKDNGLPLPFSEMAEMDFTPNNALARACTKLQHINHSLNKSLIQLSDCFAAEKQLVTVLTTFRFLATYKMVSIRQITYNEMRNQVPRYIHTYTALGIDGKKNVNVDKIKMEDSPINTDAVLLYKGRYQEGINLFPFIIDLNTLTFEDKAKICFYDSKDFNDGSLNYRFLKDNKTFN